MKIKDKVDEEINQGLRTLLEKKLKILEDKIEISYKNGEAIHKEVDLYFEVERVAKKENINIIKYNQRYHQLIDRFWKKKLEEEKGINKELYKK